MSSSGKRVTGRGSTLTVAASNASAQQKAMADYLCTGTGDQTIINAALTALPASGGTVELSEGTFNITGQIVTQKNGSTLAGQGWGATTINAETNAGVNTILVNLNHVNCVLRGVLINGNKTPNAGRNGMKCLGVGGVNAVVRDVWCQDSAGDNILISGTGITLDTVVSAGSIAIGFVLTATNGGSTQGRAINCRASGNGTQGFYVSGDLWTLTACYAYGNGGNGFNNIAGGDANTYIGCYALQNTAAGFANDGGNDILFSGCVSNSNTTALSHAGGLTTVSGGEFCYSGNMGIVVGTGGQAHISGALVVQNATVGIYTAVPNTMIVGCRVRMNGQHGIWLDAAATASMVVGNRCSDNSTGTNNTYSGIAVSSSDNFVSGNQVRQGALAGNKQLYGIHVGSGSNSFIGLNDLFDSHGVGGAPIADAGTNSRRVSKYQTAGNTGATSQATLSTWFDVPDLVTTYVAQGGPLLVFVNAEILNSVVGAAILVRVMVDGVANGLTTEINIAAANLRHQLAMVVLVPTVTAGARVLKVQWFTNAGTMSMYTRLMTVEEVAR